MRFANAAALVQGLVRAWDARRRLALWRMVEGLMVGKQLGVAALGRVLRGTTSEKHKIKAVDRFLGNNALDQTVVTSALLQRLVRRGRATLLLDWTDLDEEREALVAAVPHGGRSQPVAWHVSKKGSYLRSRNAEETAFIRSLRALLASDFELVIVADRGFARASLMRALRESGIHYVIRGRRDVHVVDKRAGCPLGNRRIARGKVRDLGQVEYGDNAREPARCVLTFQETKKRAKEPWYLLTDLDQSEMRAEHVVATYALRMRIEQAFRDLKNRHGFGLRGTRLTESRRYERLLLVAAVAMLILTQVGAFAAREGLAARMRANTSTERTHSFLSLGMHFLERIPGVVPLGYDLGA